jgi:hypothetical protein
MTPAKALPVGGIERGTAVLTLDNMISEEARGCGDRAPSPLLDLLTSIAGAFQNLLAPSTMFSG